MMATNGYVTFDNPQDKHHYQVEPDTNSRLRPRVAGVSSNGRPRHPVSRNVERCARKVTGTAGVRGNVSTAAID